MKKISVSLVITLSILTHLYSAQDTAIVSFLNSADNRANILRDVTHETASKMGLALFKMPRVTTLVESEGYTFYPSGSKAGHPQDSFIHYYYKQPTKELTISNKRSSLQLRLTKYPKIILSNDFSLFYPEEEDLYRLALTLARVLEAAPVEHTTTFLDVEKESYELWKKHPELEHLEHSINLSQRMELLKKYSFKSKTKEL